MIEISLIVGVCVFVGSLILFRRIKFNSDAEDNQEASEKLTWGQIFYAAITFASLVGFIMWFLTGGFVVIFQNDGVSCGRYEDLDSCVESREKTLMDNRL